MSSSSLLASSTPTPQYNVWRIYKTLQWLNILTYLCFTAVNLFAFSLSFALRDRVGIDPPDQSKYRYGIGKETFLTPAPWIYVVLFAAHVFFAGTLAFTQWAERGWDIVLGGLQLRWPLLMVLSTVWTGTWVTQRYSWSWVFAMIIAVLAMDITRIVRRRYRLENHIDWNDEVFIHIPFSLYHGWTLFIFAVNIFTTFSPVSSTSGLPFKIIAVWILAILSGIAHFQAFSTRSGDLPMTFVISVGQFAIFAQQLQQKNTNSQHVIAWFAFAFGFVSVWALAKSLWGTIDVVRRGAETVHLEEGRAEGIAGPGT